MAKVKAVPRARRNYEYDHHYGLKVGTARKARHGGVSTGGTSPGPAQASKAKRAGKKR
jgi:hypothetical protein